MEHSVRAGGSFRNAAGSRSTAVPILGRAAVFACAILSSAGAARAEQQWAPRVAAVYKLHMLGLEIATFHFNSTVTDGKYQLAGHSKMSWAMGLYKYTGNFTGSGSISGDGVAPSSYVYDWKVNSKHGGVRLGFGADGVEKVAIAPPHEPAPDVVPLKDAHLRGVFDPLSSLLVLSHHLGGNPCDRRIGVFEGKQRFDVVLTPHRTEKLAEKKPSGQPTAGQVCRARYVPVAGHRLNKETQALIKAEGIEIAFRLVPQAHLAIPYRINIPTPLGIAVLTAQKVDITGPGNRQIALSH